MKLRNTSRGLKELGFLLLPMVITWFVYGSQKWLVPYLRGEIHVAGPYEIEKALFGIETSAGRLTPNEWLQSIQHWSLDLVTGTTYILYIAEFLVVALCLNFLFAKKRLAAQMTWSFFIINISGYLIYYLYPAAPPWYVTEHGFAPPPPDLPSSPAGAIRVDHLLGLTVFQDFYRQCTNVFAAIPSLHVAYPLIAFCFAMRAKVLRAPTAAFFLLMCFSALYLNHHYLIDLIAGAALAVLVFLLSERTPPPFFPVPENILPMKRKVPEHAHEESDHELRDRLIDLTEVSEDKNPASVQK